MPNFYPESPGYLFLLLFVPLIWWFSFRSLSGLGRYRRMFALLLRTAVVVLLVMALANVQLRRTMDKMTVIFLLDQSASIPLEQRQAMVDYVRAAVEHHRDDARGDKASVIVFGRQAVVEEPPLQDDVLITGDLGTLDALRDDATNLMAAMEIAKGLFPEDSAKRIVVITDGNENIGNARAMAQLLARDGIGVDVHPVGLSTQADVAVERVILPSDVRRDQPLDARVVINNLADSGTVKGSLRLERRAGSAVSILAEEENIDLPPGKRVFSFPHEIDQPDFYEYRAVFVPEKGGKDRIQQNNRATAFTHVKGKSQILLIEDFENRDASTGRGEFETLVDRLRSMNMEVTVQFSDELFTNLAELQRYDCIVLANVPRSSGEDAESIYHFSDQQLRMLVRNTQELGCGLIMLGGENSFGAGGWSNTELEKAMPVDFQIQNAKVQAVGALAMIFHASEMADGNNWQKKIGVEALKVLGPQDFCGVVHWEGSESWLWNPPEGLMRVGGNRQKMIGRMSRMTPGDMPDFDPSMKMAAAAFSNLQEAAVKHMIIISDGDPSQPTGNTLGLFRKLKVKISTVAVGAHGTVGHQTLQRIATATGGKYYVAKNPNALPRIFQREARRVARPLIYERPVTPRIVSRHEMLRGIDDTIPPTRGFVMTTIKENPLVDVQLIAPQLPDRRNATIMASWQFGLGRSVAFTTDAGKRWATQWTGWEQYDKLFSQMIRWASRPSGDTGDFTIATNVKDGKVQVIVTALDDASDFRNFLGMSSSVVGPDMEARELSIDQTAPGRYVGSFEATKSGSYFVTVLPGQGEVPLRVGVNVPYSQEYRDRETNQALLETLVKLTPKGGEPGQQIAGSLTSGDLDQLLEVNTFRHNLAKAISSNYIWPLLLVIAGCVFFADVFVRRVAVSFDWMRPMFQTLRNTVAGADQDEEPDQRLARLRSRKAEVDQEFDQRRATARFEPSSESDANVDILEHSTKLDVASKEKTSPTKSEFDAGEVDQDDYTSRLLKAKKKAQGSRPSPDRE